MATQLNKSMVSELSIANQVLGKLGSNPIVSFTERSTSAELMRNNYPFLRDAVLTDAAWTFATDRDTSTTADKDDWGVMFKHPIPIDWLQVLRVYRTVSASSLMSNKDWVREGNFVLSKESTIYFWGIRRITDTALFSPNFVQLLVVRMAAELCMPITRNLQKEARLWVELGAKLAMAKTSDGVQGSNETITSNSLIDARYGGGYY